MPDLESSHVDYPKAVLRREDLAADPIVQFRQWLEQAIAAGEPEPYSMTLATCTRSAKPSARVVYLRGFDARGFVFYTHYASRKGEELAANPRACLVSYWPALHRSVRVDGAVARTSDAESDAYFAGRPRNSQLGAWASPQSRVLDDRADLERRVAKIARRFPDEVPRPAFWGGFRLAPESLEFWQGRESRLHDRLRYRLDPGGSWRIERLAP